MNKREQRQEAVERLRKYVDGSFVYRNFAHAIVGDRYLDINGEECIRSIIDLLTDDDGLTEDDYLALLRDAARDYEMNVGLWHDFAREQTKYIGRQTIALPRDADGAPIHLWDKVTYHGPCESRRGKVFEVRGYGSFDGSLNAVVVYDTKFVMLHAIDCKHYHKPTVKDVLREFAHVGIRIGAENGIQLGKVNLYADEEMIEKFAKKLQLKEDE